MSSGRSGGRDRQSPARFAGPLAVAVAVVAVDQWTKAAASAALGREAATHRRELLGSAVAFEYVENTGAAFGVLAGQGALLTVGAVAIIALLVWCFARSGRMSAAVVLSLGLVAGGASGNVIDRIRLGYVVDYIAIGVWPRFNLADCAVTVGVVVLAWVLASDDRPPASGSTSRAGSNVRSGSYEGG